jgi:hypothetical protein
LGRVKVDGKLDGRHSDIPVLEVAKLRLPDFLKDHRQELALFVVLADWNQISSSF